jgi:hypothetical protein
MENYPSIVEQKETEIKQTVLNEMDEILDSDRDSLVFTVRNHYPDIVQSLIDSAKGMWVEKSVEIKNSKGIPSGLFVRRVYQEKPNTDVAQYLLNQLVGKPKETQVMEGRVIFKRDF